ncbi:hypothetical protein [Chryseobacterium gwangjuense]|uniref:hypothetical protein n=1 Tax=Chryseobacterium gwangjuense TaxID=1069980 RepID=UPI001E4F2CE4|nr:hypothetical protein [Chryseobacterium gwangjuense]MCE3076009.1 hypothetical protein [Chryseobacterium gwangjuense]
MKKNLILLLFFAFSNIINAQNEEINLFKNILKKGDSISKTKIDTIQIFKIANNLDKKHPSQYFEEMANYLSIEKYNEAAFLFYLGQMRYKYYNSANPKYQPGNDGALLASLKMVLGEPINLYARINADNFINILALTKMYYKNKDYKFYPKKKEEEKYDVQIKNVDELIKTIENEKPDLEENWKEERKKYIELYLNK